MRPFNRLWIWFCGTPARRLPAEPGPALAPIRLGPSVWLWRIQCALHGLLALGAVLVVRPHLAGQALWWLVLLVALCALGVSLWRCRRLRVPDGAELACDHRGWRWRDARGERYVDPVGEWLVWPQLVLLRFAEPDGRGLTLTLLPDSAHPDALRRLRVWLRNL